MGGRTVLIRRVDHHSQSALGVPRGKNFVPLDNFRQNRRLRRKQTADKILRPLRFARFGEREKAICIAGKKWPGPLRYFRKKPRGLSAPL